MLAGLALGQAGAAPGQVPAPFNRNDKTSGEDMNLMDRITLRRRLAALALGSALALGATAAQAEMVLHRGTGGEPGTLDPHQASGVWENDVVGDLFLGLLTEAADNTSIPGAATDWKISDDGTVYTFNMRDGATWSDSIRSRTPRRSTAARWPAWTDWA
jgi:ABC-type oligopeptide transport system substrate-binding subunit